MSETVTEPLRELPVVRAVGQQVSSGKQEVRKSNTEIGYKIQSGHLSLLSRKLVNILLYYAQRMRGQEDDEGKFWVDAPRIIKDAKFNSRDYDLLREALDELQSVRIIRPTLNGGITSDVLIPSFTLENKVHLDNEALATGQKKRGGLLVVGFSFPAHIKDLLLDPRNNYTALPIIYVASLRTIGGIVLYEIAKRYATNPSGVTNREPWSWWWRILTGAADGAEPPEYKYFKRDVVKRAVEEINSVTDVRVALLEYKEGRFVKEIQFAVEVARQASLELEPPPMDTEILSRMTALGVSTSDAERLIQRYQEEELKSNLDLVEARVANSALPPLGSTAAYLKSALKGSYGAGKQSQETAKQQKARIAREKSDLAEATKEGNREAQLAASEAIRAAAQAWHDELPLPRQDELLSEFSTTLFGPVAASFRKTGLKTKLVAAAWASWIVHQQAAEACR